MNEKVFLLLHRDFPDFEPTHTFEAGIPIYLLRLLIEVLEPQKLTSFQLYFLHAVELGVNTRSALAHLLGVQDRDLIAPGASLLKQGYIEQGLPTPQKERPIHLTPNGRRVLAQNGILPIPKRKTCILHLNQITQALQLFDETAWSADRMAKEGIAVLPSSQQEVPTLGDLDTKDVASALRGNPTFQNNDVLALIDLQKVEAMYIAPVTVAQLQHRETNEQQIAIYRHGMQQRTEAAVVQRLIEKRLWSIPSDAAIYESQLSLPISLPAPVIQTAQALEKSEHMLSKLERQLVREAEQKIVTTNDQEQGANEDRNDQLKKELQIKREENERLHRQLHQSQVTFLRTEEHRPLLEKALREAREEVIIISPWMNRNACDDPLCRLFGDAIARGITIRIGYGMGKERNTEEAERNRTNVRTVTSALRRYIPPQAAHLLTLQETGGTHQKILVCDRIFAVVGSFNWLSYAGRRDDGYRNETGVLLQSLDAVMKAVETASQALASGSPPSPVLRSNRGN